MIYIKPYFIIEKLWPDEPIGSPTISFRGAAHFYGPDVWFLPKNWFFCVYRFPQ